MGLPASNGTDDLRRAASSTVAANQLRQLEKQRSRGEVSREEFQQAKLRLASQHGMTVADLNAVPKPSKPKAGQRKASGEFDASATFAAVGILLAAFFVLLVVAIFKFGVIGAIAVAILAFLIGPPLVWIFGLVGLGIDAFRNL